LNVSKLTGQFAFLSFRWDPTRCYILTLFWNVQNLFVVFRCNSFHGYGMFITFGKIFIFSFFLVHVPEINVCRKSSLPQWELVWQIRAQSSIQCGIKNLSKHSYRRRKNERREKQQSGKPKQLILGILRYRRQSSDASRQH
jgi:hypothetical protein